MKYAALVLKNLTRNRRRTILTVLSIAVSLFIFSALASLPTVANQILADSASSVRIACHNKAGLAYSLPEAYKQRIAATPHVVAVIAESWFGGIYHEVSDEFPNLAVDPEQIDVMWPDWGIVARSDRAIQTPAHGMPGRAFAPCSASTGTSASRSCCAARSIRSTSRSRSSARWAARRRRIS